MSKHSKAPWSIRGHTVVDADGKWICSLHAIRDYLPGAEKTLFGVQEANEALIIAAPDLLRSLMLARGMLNANGATDEELETIDASIRKAQPIGYDSSSETSKFIDALEKQVDSKHIKGDSS